MTMLEERVLFRNVPQCSVQTEHAKSLILQSFLPFWGCLFLCSLNIYPLRKFFFVLTVLTSPAIAIREPFGKRVIPPEQRNKLPSNVVTR